MERGRGAHEFRRWHGTVRWCISYIVSVVHAARKYLYAFLSSRLSLVYPSPLLSLSLFLFACLCVDLY